MTDKIYKYLDIYGLECVLKNSTLKFTMPVDFNDPFEFHDSLVEREISFEYWIEIVKEREPHISKKRLQKFITEFKNNPKGFKEEMNVQFQKRKDSTKISCFSKVNDSLLMWSHYSDKHKGACIEFSLNDLITDFKYDFQILEVNYSDIIEPKNISKDKEKAIDYWISTKAKEWDYENELRLILGSNPQEFQKIDRQAIKHVFFGCKVTENEKNRIEKFIFEDLLLSWLKTSEMKISKTEFKLEINNRR